MKTHPLHESTFESIRLQRIVSPGQWTNHIACLLIYKHKTFSALSWAVHVCVCVLPVLVVSELTLDLQLWFHIDWFQPAAALWSETQSKTINRSAPCFSTDKAALVVVLPCSEVMSPWSPSQRRSFLRSSLSAEHMLAAAPDTPESADGNEAPPLHAHTPEMHIQSDQQQNQSDWSPFLLKHFTCIRINQT